MKTRFNRFTMITAITALSLFALSPAFATNYIITDLGTFGGTGSIALGINNLDEVVGQANLPGDIVYHAFLYKGGVMTDLGTANCTYLYGFSLAWRINDSGQIAGQQCFLTPQGNYERAALYSGGVWTNLGTLGGGGSIGRGINNLGHVVGWAATPGDQTSHAFLYKDGVMNDIGILISAFCCNLAYGINDSDQIVGTFRFSSAAMNHAFLYSGGVMTDLTPSLGCCSAAYDINNSGQVVGTTYFPGTVTHPFLYSGGVLTDLGGLGGPHPEAEGEGLGINDQGQIVGWSFVPGTIPHAFIYSDGIMTDLNNKLPSNSGWELNYAVDINNKGRIVGAGTINGQSHAFLMVPLILPVIDYDGDGKTDIAVYHSASGLWFIKPSSGAADYYVGYGGTGYMPVNMDYLHGYVY